MYEDMFEKPYKPLKQMSKKQMEKELLQWRNLFTWLEREAQFWLTSVGQEVALKGRDYKVMTGILGQPHFIMDAIDITWVERVYNYFKKEATYLTKTTTVRINQLADYSFIHNKEVREEEYSGAPVEAELDEILQPEEIEGE